MEVKENIDEIKGQILEKYGEFCKGEAFTYKFMNPLLIQDRRMFCTLNIEKV